MTNDTQTTATDTHDSVTVPMKKVWRTSTFILLVLSVLAAPLVVIGYATLADRALNPDDAERFKSALWSVPTVLATIFGAGTAGNSFIARYGKMAAELLGVKNVNTPAAAVVPELVSGGIVRGLGQGVLGQVAQYASEDFVASLPEMTATDADTLNAEAIAQQQAEEGD